jgi:hypothetical protein
MTRSILSLLTLALLPSLSAIGAEPPPTAPTPRTVTGEVIVVTDDFYVVKDADGKPTQLRLSKNFQDGNKDTRIEGGHIKQGDKVEAEVEPDGHALSIKKAR